VLSLAPEEGPFFQASDTVKAVKRNLGSGNRNEREYDLTMIHGALESFVEVYV